MHLKIRKSFLLSAVLFLAVFYVGLSAYAASRLTRVERLPLQVTPADFGLSFEDVTFPSDVDSLQIKGWYMPAKGSGRILLLVHGERCHRAHPGIGIIEVAQAMVGKGFNVLAFDLRGRGESPPGRNTLGVLEQRDLKGAVRYAVSRGFDQSSIGVIGWSMGAATTLMTAVSTPGLNAVVADSSFADLPGILKIQVPKRSVLPGFFVPSIITMINLIYGVDLNSIRPIKAAVNINETRVFIIHGMEDKLIPVEHARRIFEALKQHPGNELWMVPEAEHARSFRAAPEEYVNRVSAFFDRELQ